MYQSQILQPCFWIWEKLKNHKSFAQRNYHFFDEIQFVTKGTLFRVLFVHPWCLYWRKYIFDLKFTIKGSIIMKWGHGCKIWDWSIILYYFSKYLTCMLTLGLRSYRSSNLVIDLKMWEKSESNLPVCTFEWQVCGAEMLEFHVNRTHCFLSISNASWRRCF